MCASYAYVHEFVRERHALLLQRLELPHALGGVARQRLQRQMCRFLK